MEQRPLYPGGPLVSALGLGCNAFGGRIDAAGSRAVVEAALDAGVTIFDTADCYGRPFGASEEMLAAALAGRRDGVFIATKGGLSPAGFDQPPNASAGWLRQALDDSLRRLRVEQIDLYQLHFPDAATPIDETLRAMQEMLTSGKVAHIGCSNFSPEQVEEASEAARRIGATPFCTTQDEYSLLVRGKGEALLPVLGRLGMGLLPYFPLAGGLLTGKYRQPAPPAGSRFAREPRMADLFLGSETKRAGVEALSAFAEVRDRTLIDLAFAWLLAEPAIGSVIAGATTADQVRTNAAATEWRLDAADLAELTALLRTLPE